MSLARTREPRNGSSQGLIGRAKELAALDRRLEALATGDGSFVEIVGEAGIGKTALLGALAARGADRGFLVLSGRASQFELETPFDPFVDALDDHLASVNPRRWEPLGEERVSELASAFPSLADATEGHAATLPSEERYRVHRSVRELLALMAKAKPLVLVIDDAHWSDQASLELLRHLVRRPPAGAATVVIAYRTGTMPESWQRLADTALREGDIGRIEIGPLSRAEADLLLGDRIADAELRARLFSATGGNPFFMRQVAEAPQVVADEPAARTGEGVPPAVVAAIAEEVAALGEPAREALRAAAVAGDPFDPAHAAAAGSVGEAELLPHLDGLGRRDLIRSGDSPRRFQFRHPLVWQAVYENAPPGWRLAAHRRLAEHLASQGAGAQARAPHVEAAAQPGDAEAVAVLREAADASAARAPASAAHWLEAALRLVPERPDTAAERISLLVPIATTLGSIGRIEESRDRLRQVIALIPPDATSELIEATIACATMENLLRNLAEATRMLTGALDSLDDPEGEQAAEILVALSTLHLFDYEIETACEWGGRALELADRRGMRAQAAVAAATLSYNTGRAGRIPEALALLDRGAGLAEEFSGEAGAADLPALFWNTPAAMQVERFEDSIRYGDRARELARATGQGRWLPQIAAASSWSLWGLGRLPEAIALLGEGAEMAELTGNRFFGALVESGRAQMLPGAGSLKEALAAGQRAIDLAGTVESGDHIAVYARQNAATAALESGDPARARELMLETVDHDGELRIELPWRPWGLRVLSAAELALGDLESAERHAQRSIELAEELGLGTRRSWALQALGAVELAKGNASMAAEIAERAAAAAAGAHAPIEEGRGLALAGRALAEDGSRDAGIERLRRAHELLDSCGAAHYRDAAARELRALGVRVGRTARPGKGGGIGALSPREREIAELIAEGRSNKEIGAALFISPKTVEKHLGKAFGKLGVSKRAQVAAAIERERASPAED